jgi:FKBP-type peptidyl-prolyl cis-trans isomerase FkpA
VTHARAVQAAFRLAVLGVLAGGLAACGGSPTSPSSAVPFNMTDLVVGEGTEAVASSLVTVHYTGWLYNAAQPDQKGAQFGSSGGLAPFSFTLGNGSVIAGWDQGLTGMKVGGLRRLVIPSSLAYGATRSGPIPPYATLVFEVELLDVQ